MDVLDLLSRYLSMCLFVCQFGPPTKILSAWLSTDRLSGCLCLTISQSDSRSLGNSDCPCLTVWVSDGPTFWLSNGQTVWLPYCLTTWFSDPRPGKCPRLLPPEFCISDHDECENDADCYPGKKCCSNTCFSRCVNPSFEEIGGKLSSNLFHCALVIVQRSY